MSLTIPEGLNVDKTIEFLEEAYLSGDTTAAILAGEADTRKTVRDWAMPLRAQAAPGSLPPLSPAAAGAPAPGVATIDNLTQTVHKLADLGLSSVDDFDEGDYLDECTDEVPPGLPEFLGGQRMKYPRIGADNIATHHLTTPRRGKRPLAVPVTRRIFPDLPESLLNVQGYYPIKDTIVCVLPESVWDAYRAAKDAAKNAHYQSLIEPRRKDVTGSDTPAGKVRTTFEESYLDEPDAIPIPGKGALAGAR
jgi:hypothetical protein